MADTMTDIERSVADELMKDTRLFKANGNPKKPTSRDQIQHTIDELLVLVKALETVRDRLA